MHGVIEKLQKKKQTRQLSTHMFRSTRQWTGDYLLFAGGGVVHPRVFIWLPLGVIGGNVVKVISDSSDSSYAGRKILWLPAFLC